MGAVEVKVIREVDTDEVFGKPILKFFEGIMHAAYDDVSPEGRVPVDTGALQNSLAPGAGVTEFGGSMAEGFYAQVGSSIAVYPSVLELSPRYHYLRGPSQGSQTLGWLSQTAENIQPAINALANTLAGDIEAAWNG